MDFDNVAFIVPIFARLLKSAAILGLNLMVILCAIIAGSLTGSFIPHEQSGRLDPFSDWLIFGWVFLAGLGIGRGYRLGELCITLAITLSLVFAIDCVYTSFPDFSMWWFLYGCRLVVLPLFLALLLQYFYQLVRNRR